MRTASVPSSARRASVGALLASMLLLAACGSSSNTASSTTDQVGDGPDSSTTFVVEKYLDDTCGVDISDN